MKLNVAIAVITCNGGTVTGPEISRALKGVIETAAKEWIEAENEIECTEQTANQSPLAPSITDSEVELE